MASQHHYSVAEIAAFKKRISDERRAWLEKQHKKSPRCYYCKNMTTLLPRGANSRIAQVPGTFHATLDHAQPQARGGKDNQSNYRLACCTCNNLKGSMTEKEYIQLLKDEGIR